MKSNRFSFRLRRIWLALAVACVAAPVEAQQTGRSGAVQDTATARRAVEQQLGRGVSTSDIIEVDVIAHAIGQGLAAAAVGT